MSWLEERLSLGSPILDYQLFILGGTPVTVATVAVFLVIVVLTFIVSRLIQKALNRAMKARKVKDEGTVEVVRRLLHYAVLAVGFGIALQTIGINLGALFAAGAFLAIGLGFAMQNIMQNFVSGIILLTERSITPGDVLQVEGRFVRVQKMGVRATIARSLDEEEIIVPNSTIVQSTVTNYTLRDSLYRLRCTVGVVYGSDMLKVKEVLERTASAIPWRVEEKEPVILLIDFGDSAVNWEISVWMTDPWRVRAARSELNLAIWWALKEAGITIAFPQLDVHLDPHIEQALGGRSTAE